MNELDPSDRADLIIEAINARRAWIETQARENAYARNQPGSTSSPYWTTGELHAAIISGLNAGEDETFNVFEVKLALNPLKTAAEAVGFGFQGPSEHFPFSANITDATKPAYGGYDAYALFFKPTGEFYAAHGRNLHIRVSDYSDAQSAANAFIAGMYADRQVQLDKDQADRVAKAMAAERRREREYRNSEEAANKTAAALASKHANIINPPAAFTKEAAAEVVHRTPRRGRPPKTPTK